MPLTQETAEATQLTPRFAIPQRRADGSTKIWAIEDLRASAVNKTLSMRDTAVSDSLDVFFATAAYYRAILPECDLMAASVDFSDAYKNVGIFSGQEALRRRL